MNESYWLLAIKLYVSLAGFTALPVIWTVFSNVPLNKAGPHFDVSPHFTDAEKLLLQQHYERIRGTLSFWKTQAERYKRAHFYCLSWTIPSSVIVPVLAQATDTDAYSKWLITVVSAFSAILLALHRAFKVSDNYRAYREGESMFYDTYRRMLDRPETFGDASTRVERYFAEVEELRKFIRNTETDNTPSLDQTKSQKAEDSG
ncbi:DUF4231 domain-containing protein [Rhizobium sp. KAs_5_22]|uniref:DUF4231 domain-containing protein n=1 Tax=Ciceribacter selenitireducens TaxID=448181 RepID=UPI00048DA270|nr:DUF4231 domain-containing protein [Ciceribacter selenitireducens]PPJ49150.1 DUF4231 domain-containing protein [Rhizobium sp. KAs_5_22]